MNPVKIEETDDGVFLFKYEDDKSQLRFEANNRIVWVLDVIVKKQYRKQGVATKLIEDLFKYCAKNNLEVINWGIFTYQGNKYIRHVIDRIGELFPTIKSQYD